MSRIILKKKVINMDIKIRDLNEIEVAISKNDLLDILDEIQELRDMVFTQKEIISKIANIKGK